MKQSIKIIMNLASLKPPQLETLQGDAMIDGQFLLEIIFYFLIKASIVISEDAENLIKIETRDFFHITQQVLLTT